MSVHAFRNRVHINQPYEVKKEKNRGYINILFHKKGIELNLPRILHDKNVVGAIPLFVDNREPPIVKKLIEN